jgi:hypothetical protein
MLLATGSFRTAEAQSGFARHCSDVALDFNCIIGERLFANPGAKRSRRG